MVQMFQACWEALSANPLPSVRHPGCLPLILARKTIAGATFGSMTSPPETYAG
jgi:hypothetical protein